MSKKVNRRKSNKKVFLDKALRYKGFVKKDKNCRKLVLIFTDYKFKLKLIIKKDIYA